LAEAGIVRSGVDIGTGEETKMINIQFSTINPQGKDSTPYLKIDS